MKGGRIFSANMVIHEVQAHKTQMHRPRGFLRGSSSLILFEVKNLVKYFGGLAG